MHIINSVRKNDREETNQTNDKEWFKKTLELYLAAILLHITAAAAFTHLPAPFYLPLRHASIKTGKPLSQRREQ